LPVAALSKSKLKSEDAADGGQDESGPAHQQ